MLAAVNPRKQTIHQSVVVYRALSLPNHAIFPLPAIIEMNNFIALAGRDVRWGGGRYIRLKLAVHGNYQTKRTDNSTGRESLYINSFCSPTRSFRRRMVKFRQFFFCELFVFRHLSFSDTFGSLVFNIELIAST